MEDSYPTIGINANGTVEASPSGKYFWRIGTHIEGPDDVIDRESALFETRQKATEDMLERFEIVVKEQLTELFGN